MCAIYLVEQRKCKKKKTKTELYVTLMIKRNVACKYVQVKKINPTYYRSHMEKVQ